MALTYSPHPLIAAADRVTIEWHPGDTLAEVLARLGVAAHVPLAVHVDGVRVAPDLWRTILPREGQTITVRALVHGGGGGSNPISAVLSIALNFVAPGLGEAVAWSLVDTLALDIVGHTMVATLASGAISMAGNALIGAVFKPNASAISHANALSPGMNPSPSYNLQGSRNRLRPFEPLPLIYGRHRFVPDMASKPYTYYKGNKQYLKQVFNCGLSDLVLSDWKVGATLLTNYAEWSMREANPDGRIEGFHDNVDTLEGGALDYNVPITRTLSAGTEAVNIDIQGLAFNVNAESGDMLPLDVGFQAFYREVGSGTWLNLAETEVTAQYDAYWSAGYAGETGWVQVASGTTRANQYVEGAAYTPPKGSVFYGDGGTYTWHWLDYDDAAHIPDSQKPVRTYKTTSSVYIITGNTRDTIRRTLAKTDLDPTKTYEVLVKRITVTSTTPAVSEFTCPSIRCFQKVDYAITQLAGQRRIGVEIKATGQLNGTLDEINCVASARVRVGTSPTAAYAESSNPAWIFLDFIRGRRNADEQRMYGVCLAEERIDLDLIDDWATFCTSNNLEFNGIIDQRMSCAEVLQLIARTGRGSVTWNTGKLGVVWDAANQPVTAVFGMANIRAGTFRVQYATGGLADEVVVNFINRDREWQRDTLRKAKPGVTNPTNPIELELFGVTSEDQAGREAALLAAGQQYRRRIMTWETDVEGLVVTRGDVVMLSHDMTQWGYSGRVVSFPTAGSVKLPRNVPATTGEYLMLRAPDGTLYTTTITNVTGETDVLTATLPAISGNVIDWLWFYGPTATPGKKVKVTSIEPLDELHVRITAVDEEAVYYAAESDPWSYTPPESVSLLAPRVTRLVLREGLAFSSGAWVPTVGIDWSVENATSALVSVTRNGTVIYNQTVADGSTHLEYVGAVGDEFVASVVPTAISGIRGTTGTASLTLAGSEINAAPADVPRINATYEGKIIWLQWDVVDDFRGVSYEVRWGDSWGSGVAYPVGTSLRFKTQGDGNYWVKAKTANGIYSTNPKGIRIEGASLVDNVIVTIDEDNTWGGTHDSTYIEPAGKLSLAGSGLFSSIGLLSDVAPSLALYGGYDAEGYYRITPANVVDLDRPAACQITTALTFDVHDDSVLFSEHASIAALPSIKMPNGGSGSVDVEMNLAQADAVYAGWQPFRPGTYFAQYFDFRLRLTSDTATVSPFVETWTLSVDVPDRIESQQVDTPAGTLAVSFTPPFRDVPKVQATVQNATAGDDIVITSLTAAGFTLAVKNGGSNVARTVHTLAQGY